MSDMQQGSPEWLRERAGKINASEISAVFGVGEGVFASGPRKGAPRPDSKARTDLIDKIVAEILTGEPASIVRAKALDWGHDIEGAARSAYSAETGFWIDQVATATHPIYPFIRCSPDGVIRPKGGVQIKCPANSANHIDAIRNGMHEDHKPQVQAEIMVQELDWLDFINYDPRMLNEPDRLYIQRIYPDREFIAQMESHCLSLWVEVQSVIESITKRRAA